ncbi:RING finger protein 141-like [Ipomoea triloba]|uniref:RING finger protein 141-like n=1 Tax=Ipomoea triloba TaxID=35885 RepID=UPI00125DCF10|nr:RING finger protein 141-like [Ipomoea triloba]
MEGGGDGGWKLRTKLNSLKRRLTLLACCGSSRNLRVSEMEEKAQLQARSRFYIDDSEEEEEHAMAMPRRSLNLATALAAERDLRSVGPTAQQMKTLVRLFEETDGRDENSAAIGGESLCCVCMERNRGAALIPCGHTYCRVCSRELWLNKRSCPLCNLSIRETLHIF